MDFQITKFEAKTAYEPKLKDFDGYSLFLKVIMFGNLLLFVWSYYYSNESKNL